MCWNIGVSLAATAVHAVSFIIVANKKVPEYRSYLLFTGFFMIMEVFQALQWWIGEVGVGIVCTERNRLMTMIAYLLIWLQPLLFVKIGERSQLHAVQVRLQFARRLAILTAWYAMTNLFLGLLVRPKHLLPGSSFGSETCTTVGPHGHLAWSFAPLTITYGPTHFVYVASILTTISFYPRPLFTTIGIGWIGTLLISICLVGIGIELPAFWCLLSVFVDVPIIVRSLLH